MTKSIASNLTTSGIILICILAWAAVSRAESDLEKNMAVQVMLGATKYDGLVFEEQSAQDPATTAEAEFTWLPLIGLSGQLPILRNRMDFGLEGGLMGGWKRDSTYAHGQNGNVTVYFKNSLWLVDLSMGPYLSVNVKDKVRLYGACGPMLMGGSYTLEAEETDSVEEYIEARSDSDSVFGPGFYGRAGVEFRLPDNSLMGFGVRVYTVQLDFGNIAGTQDVKAVQFMLTYTIGA
ncbi:MAG: outer membrane beta-barrel protein [Thermodesulfobacteriota bacterium]